jgi:hypothetical protein
VPNDQKVLGVPRGVILDHLAGRPEGFGGRYCQNAFCGRPEIPGDVLSAARIDHIIPLSSDGPDTLWNFQWLCDACNDTKRDRYGPDEWKLAAAMKELYYRGPAHLWIECEDLDWRGARLLQEEMTGEAVPPMSASYRQRSHSYAEVGPYGGRALT